MSLGAVCATVILAILRVGLVYPDSSVTPQSLIALLAATALLCLVGLTKARYPTAAWISVIAATGIVTIDLATYAATVWKDVDDRAWVGLVIAICLDALLTTGAAAAYAFSRPRLPRGWIAVAGIGVLVLVAAASVTAVATVPLAVSDPPLGNARLVTRALLVVVPFLTVLGLIGDAIAPAERAARQVAVVGSDGGRRRVAAWVRAFAGEVAPGRTRARRAVIDERSRIARDLHADVVPALRQALEDAEEGTPAETLSRSLREILAGLEDFGASQHPIQLEIGGLVPALEWLSERAESRSGMRVELNIADAVDATDGTPPTDISEAAFRVAALALDNVVRHAAGSNAEILVRTEADLVELVVSDDGPGMAPDALTNAVAHGRRGVADMRSEAAACGAEIEVARRLDGAGTTVRFRWQNPSRQAN